MRDVYIDHATWCQRRDAALFRQLNELRMDERLRKVIAIAILRVATFGLLP